MNAPANIDRLALRINAANTRAAKAQQCIDLLEKYKRFTVEAVTSRNSAFWEEVTAYQLAGAMSSLFGVDSFEEMEENAAHELWSEHSYDIKEEMDLDADGFAKAPFRVTQGMGG